MYFVNEDPSLYYTDFGAALADAWVCSRAHDGLPILVHEVDDELEITKLVASVEFRE